MNAASLTMESIYDLYSPMLYGIAIKISPTPQIADKVHIETFRKISRQKTIQKGHPSLCFRLIKALIETAYEQIPSAKNTLQLKHFEFTPLLHKLLCEEYSLETHCAEKKLSTVEARQIIRAEFNLLRQKNGSPQPIEQVD